MHNVAGHKKLVSTCDRIQNQQAKAQLMVEQDFVADSSLN